MTTHKGWWPPTDLFLACWCGKEWWTRHPTPQVCPKCRQLVTFVAPNTYPTLNPVHQKKLLKRKRKPKPFDNSIIGRIRRAIARRDEERQRCYATGPFSPELDFARAQQQRATRRAIKAGIRPWWIKETELKKVLPKPRNITLWDGIEQPTSEVSGSPNWRKAGTMTPFDGDSPLWHNVVRAVEDG